MTQAAAEGSFAPAQIADVSADQAYTACGLTLSLAPADGGGSYLLIGSSAASDPLTLLLPAAAGRPSGLAVFSRLGRLHARHWAIVWEAGAPPATGVAFSSGDVRFRRETHSAAFAVGPAWVAVAEGGFREATIDPDGLTPRWLPLARSR